MGTRRPGVKAWPVLGVALIQALLLLAHWFIYRTWIDFGFPLSPPALEALRIGLLLLSVSFMAAALLSFRFANAPVAFFYKLAAVWLGLLNFFFLAACLSWLADFVLRVLTLHAHRPAIAAVLFGLAVLAGVYGALNARWVRVRRIGVKLPNLPLAWRGRTAVLLSDLHLGNMNGVAFSRRIAAMTAQLNPDIVFIPGDLFDGTKVDPDRLAAPFREISAPFGIYFVTGNHEEYGGAGQYTDALARNGVRILANEKAVVDDLTILGIPYVDSTFPMRVRSTLDSMRLEPGHASILLNHVPNRLPIVEQAGVSLQLSGHTHGGQIFPFTWFTRRAFGEFTYGLQRFGALQVYTSSGAGTWGPPMRVGTHPEIVEITLEREDP
jgi:predicted MPP superfamily phosphohydrolase